MNKKIVLPLALLAAGTIAYFLIKKKDNVSGEVLPPPLPAPAPGPTPSNPLGNSQMVKNFQIYYNRVKPIPYANLVVDGIYGKLTKAAYIEFKDRYINFLNTGGQFTNYILGLSENKNIEKNKFTKLVLTLMDRDFSYTDALNFVVKNFKVNRKKLEKDLNKYI